jgi:hypothetical protein
MFARGARMPDRSGSGTALVDGAGLQIVIEQHPGATTIQAAAPSVGVLIDVEIPLPQGHESLGLPGNRIRHCFGWFTGRARADDGGVDRPGRPNWMGGRSPLCLDREGPDSVRRDSAGVMGSS